MDIQIYQTKNYGTTAWYVKDDQQRETVRRITGQATLTVSARRSFESMGFTFTEVVPPSC